MAMKQPKPKPRVNSDSLMRQSIEKKNIAKSVEKVAKAQIKKDGGNKPESWDTGYTGPDGRPMRVVSGTSGNRKMQRVAELRQSASKDSLTAVQSKRMKSTKPKPTPAKPMAKTKSKSMPVKKSTAKSTK
jgi:hypothetical protein